MKKLNVLVSTKTTLILDEDGKKGDIIDLTELSNVDFSNIESLIDQGKDKVYQEKLKQREKQLALAAESNLEKELAKKDSLYKDELNKLNLKYNEEIANKNAVIDQYNKDKELDIAKLTNQHLDEINKLKAQAKEEVNDLNMLLAKKDNEKLIEINNLKQANKEEVNKLINQNEILKNEMNSLKEKEELVYEKKLSDAIREKEETYHEQIDKLTQELREKDEAYNNLRHAKSNLNVKQTGEDLESWCDYEVKSYMQNGLFNCKWTKDNLVIKDEGETKGSKADYIFEIFANENKDPEDLLTSICLDMKDENPESKTKKTNADYYKQLDLNRNKKNCKYAVLVSNLEMDKSNVIPMYRVLEYPDMYVVRPAYLMTFLNLIVSLTVRFADVINAEKKEKVQYLSQIELKEKFEKLKNTYLEKPIEALSNKVDEIIKKADTIKTSANAILELANNIIDNYINIINKKLTTFTLEINKEYRKHPEM